MSNEYSKEYVKKITTDGSGTSFIIEKWDKFLLNYSCRPNDELFPKKKLKLTNYMKTGLRRNLQKNMIYLWKKLNLSGFLHIRKSIVVG